MNNSCWWWNYYISDMNEMTLNFLWPNPNAKRSCLAVVSHSYIAAGNANENNNKVKGNDEDLLYICEIGEFKSWVFYIVKMDGPILMVYYVCRWKLCVILVVFFNDFWPSKFCFLFSFKFWNGRCRWSQMAPGSHFGVQRTTHSGKKNHFF